MNQENLMKRGRLAELEKRYSEIDITVSSDISLARTLIDPYEDPATELKDDEIEAVVFRLCANIRRQRVVATKIRTIKEDLGLL